MSNRWTRGIVVAALLPLIASFATAQEWRGRIQGIVLDPSKSVIADVTVTLKNDDTGVTTNRRTGGNGRYLFDYVDPGQYTLIFEMVGFRTLEQKNVLVQQRGDVTVNVTLPLGQVTDIVTVTESPVAVQFNTASRDLTIDSRMLKDLPSLSGNPLESALLDPQVVNRGGLDVQPYFHRASNEMDYGGGTKYRNDMLLDGTPLVAGNKLGYTPPMDAVTEYTVGQNAVDAEFGHSGGGIVIVTMKSGTNELHGSVYGYGRNPKWNAMTNRVSRAHVDNPYWRAGGTVGMPLVKNRLFMFGVFETIQNVSPADRYYTLPTELERRGDFSESRNADGSLRVLYNPFTTTKVGNNYPRTAFPGNKIPPELWDPVAKRIMDSLWLPKNNGEDATHLKNFPYLEEDRYHYFNFSARLDWQISDKWKAWARISRMKTDQDMEDFTADFGGDPLRLRSNTGSQRNGWNVAGDTVYLLNATTTVNLRGSYYQAEDKREYPEMAIGEAGWNDLWTYKNKQGQTVTNTWWRGSNFDYMAGRPLVYFPNITVDGSSTSLGVSNVWYQEPSGASFHARLSKYWPQHSFKVGTEIRLKRGQAGRFYFTNFNFTAAETGDRGNSPNARTGSPWASFLLGALNGSSNVRYNVIQVANTEMYAFYVQDDFKVNKNLTLNLGLRYEYEGGLWDPRYMLPQGLDLTDPIPGMADVIAPKMAATDPKLTATDPTNAPPTSLTALMAQSAGQKTHIYNGAYHFTEEGNKRKNKADPNGFMPRIGLAWRLDDKTALRAGYGRFVVPSSLSNSERDTLGEIDLGGFTPTTAIIRPQDNQYIPVASLSNPFANGLNPATGKVLGRYTLLGGQTVTVDKYELKPPISDRLNLSIQRELPGRLILDVGYMVNLVSRDYYNKNLNMMDPRLSFTYKAGLNTQVNNPFYNYGDASTFPGTLRTQSKVTVASLMVPYPQYGAITQTSTNLRKARYSVLLVRLQRTFSKGFSFLASYAYVRSKSQWFWDSQDEYDGTLTWMDFSVSQSGGAGNPQIQNDPRHRLRVAGSVDLPIGRDRLLGRSMPVVLDAIIGGWRLATSCTYNARAPIVFTGALTAPTSVAQFGEVGGAGKYWFQTTTIDPVTGQSTPLFSAAASYSRRSNPWTYEGLTLPSFTNVDLSLTKRFRLFKDLNLQARVDAFNALNGMNWAAPNLSYSSSDFGRTNTQYSGYVGRQIQVSARIEF